MDTISVREAGFVAGVPVKAVNKAIDAEKLPGGVVRRRRERLINRKGVLQLALEKELEQRIAPEIRPRVRAGFLKAVATADRQADCALRLGDSVVVVIEWKTISERVDRQWQRLSRVRDLIVENPDVQGGAPTFRGSRVLVWPIVEALEQGESEVDLLRHYPALDREKLEAAKLYAQVRPRRGRPKLNVRGKASRRHKGKSGRPA